MTRLTANAIPPTFTFGGSGGQFDTVMLFLQYYTNQDAIGRIFMAVTTGLPALPVA